MTPYPPTTRPIARQGMTLVEVLMALTILALLLTSLATAFHASITNYEDNREISSATQASRAVLNRITDAVRRASAVDLYAGSDRVHIVCPDDSLGRTPQYRFIHEPSQNRLRFQYYLDGTLTEDQILLGENDNIKVTSFLVTLEQGKDWQGYDCAKSVIVKLGFKAGDKPFTMSASASPRRNQEY